MKVVIWMLFLLILYLFYSHAKYSNTGIDLADESFNYFLLKSSEKGFPFKVYGNLFEPIIKILNLELAEIRMLSLVVHLLSGFILATAVKLKFCKLNNNWSPVHTAFISLTPLTLYGAQGRILSYNSFTFCVASLILSCLLFSFTCRKKGMSSTLILFCAILTGIQFGVKFPVFLILFSLIFLIILISSNYANILVFSLGTFFGIIIVYNDINFFEILKHFSVAIGEYGFARFHDSKSFFDLYFYSAYIHFFQILTKIDLIIVLFTMVYIRKSSILNSLLVLTLFGYLIIRSFYCGYLQSGDSASYFSSMPWFLAVISLIILSFYYFYKNIVYFKKIETLALIILFISPFLCSLGTNTALLKQFPIYLTFSSVLIVLLLCKLPKTKGSFLIPLYLLIITFSISFNSIFQNPVRIAQPLNLISNKPRISDAGDIRLDDNSELIISNVISFIDSNTNSGSSLPYIDIAGMPGTYLFVNKMRDFPYHGKWLDTTSTNRLERIFSELKKSSKNKILIHCKQNSRLKKFGSFESRKIIKGTNSMVGLFILNS